MAMLPDGASPAAQRRSQQLLSAPKPTAGRPTPATGGGRGGGYIAPKPKVKTTSTGKYARPSAPPPAAPGPVVPSIESFLGGDTGYQQQIRDLQQALTNFGADITRRRGSLESDFGMSQKGMQDQRTKDLESLEADYGSRGLLRSGLYGDAVGDYETEFNTRMSDLNRKQQEALAALQQEQGQFGSANQLKEQAAREMAIRRRAEQFGV